MSTPQTPAPPARPLAIALANSGRKWIGEVAHVALLYQQLEALGHRPWIVCRRGAALHRHAAENGWRYLALDLGASRNPFKWWADIRAWRRLVLEQNIDLIHCHRGKDHWRGAWVARLTRRPLVRTRHVMGRVPHNFANAWLYLKTSAAVLSVSAAVQRGFRSWRGRLPHGEVIRSAIDVARFGPGHRSEAWRRQNAGEGFQGAGDPQPVWFGLIGRFQRIKGQIVFMQAAELVARVMPEAHFVMAGAGGRHLIDKWRRRFAGVRGFGERVLVLDLVDNLPEILASLDVGVIASLGSEGNSRIALELMASGTPLAATRVGGIPELLEPAQAGHLVAAGDPDALAEAMLAWARATQAARQAAGARGRAYVLANHTPDIWVERIVQVYRTVLREHQSRKS